MNLMSQNWRLKLGSLFNPNQIEANEETELASLVQDKHSGSVLIVDDDPDWGEECSYALRAMGYEPLHALTPQDALRLYLDSDTTIAIIDYNMPGKDGISLIHELARHAQTLGRQLHIVMATGYATKDIAVDAMRASVSDFLEKPIHPSDLRRALQRISGLQDNPAARQTLLTKMSSLSSELNRLAQLIHEPQPNGTGSLKPMLGHSNNGLQFKGPAIDRSVLCDFIRDQLRKESKRRGIGGGALFGDPTWEMLLDLLLAKIEGRTVSVSSACIASGAPMSTALRLVRRLVTEDVLCRIPDEKDKRRHFLIINPKFEQPLIDYLSDQISLMNPGV